MHHLFISRRLLVKTSTWVLSLVLLPAWAQTWSLEQRTPFNQPIQTAQEVQYQPLHQASRPWQVCVLVPHLKDAYWIGVNYGLATRSRALGIGMTLYDAGGYDNSRRQLAQLKQCLNDDSDAILLGAVSADLLNHTEVEITKPVLALVNQVNHPKVKTHVGVNWYQMGQLSGQYIATLPAQRLALLVGPDKRGGTDMVESGVRDMIDQQQIISVRHADNSRNLYRDQINQMLAEHPIPQLLLGSAVAIEAAMGTVRQNNLVGELILVSVYLSPNVLRGLRRGKVAYANDDRVVIQGSLAVDLVVRTLEGEGDFGSIGPAIQRLTPHNYQDVDLSQSLAPADYYPLYRVTPEQINP
ncbi:TMAO reductase system periplasmic protein TorT [Vibrio sp.]|uniref:TMAO reductase system periplasmic protein TorT n=1 Tax=Vibrio sp. TaxID=678 RepID=UPI003D10C1B6